ncbi:MAG: cob(I)yrinic acid a,c-diamide adenosyltransferase [Proteobacteria bacterium]|nr:cob(I)yrinic acid a,c-diamide adenosyltransferase [Pseudomonadota bacterium]
MVLLSSIYTRSGDKGKTSLGNGERVLKSSIRINAIGTVDELNSFIGLSLLEDMPDDIVLLFKKIQNNLFDVGADLCMPDLDGKLDFAPLRITQDQIDFLETQIDYYNAYLSPLNSFVLPGGSKQSGYLHVLRTIARRAERLVCQIGDERPDHSPFLVISYLNRLSDLFFVLARFLNDKGQNDVLWEPGK